MVHAPQPNTFEEVYAGINPETGKRIGRVLKLGTTIDTIIECTIPTAELIGEQNSARAKAEDIVNRLLAPYLNNGTGKLYVHLDASVIENVVHARELTEKANLSEDERIAVEILETFNKLSAEQKGAMEATLRLMGKAAYYGNDLQMDPIKVIDGIANILSGLPIEQLAATPDKLANYHNGKELTVRDEISRLIETSEKYVLSPSMMHIIIGSLSSSASELRAYLSSTDTIEQKEVLQYQFIREALDHIKRIYNSHQPKADCEVAEHFNGLVSKIQEENNPGTYYSIAYFEKMSGMGVEDRSPAFYRLVHSIKGFDFAGKRDSGVKRVIMIGADGSRHDLRFNGGTEYKGVILEAANACLCRLPRQDPLYDMTSRAIRNIEEHLN